RPARGHNQTAIRGVRKRRDDALDLTGVSHVHRGHLHLERRRHSLDDAERGHPGGTARIAKDGSPRHTWPDLLEQLPILPARVVFESQEAGGVATWPRQTVDEAGANWIASDWENDWHRACHLQQRPHG